MSTINQTDRQIVKAVEGAGTKLARAREAIGAVIFGQAPVVEQALITLLCGGHGLLVGVPGLAKTKLIDTLGTVLGLDTKRIQFTPDLMPPDILGSEVLEESASGKRSFRFIKGPVFTQLLMADEINRASPRTQAALLQAMQEYHVTIAGQRHDLPRPFHVLATQNPLEQEGTYPLPEAQLDRFMMQIDVPYPDIDSERRMLFETTGIEQVQPEHTLSVEELSEIQRLVRRIPVGESVVEAILSLVRAARPASADGNRGESVITKWISWGPGPRASQALMLGVRARALIDGRFAPSIDDVAALAEPVLQQTTIGLVATNAEVEVHRDHDPGVVIGRVAGEPRVLELTVLGEEFGCSGLPGDVDPRLGRLQARTIDDRLVHAFPDYGQVVVRHIDLFPLWFDGADDGSIGINDGVRHLWGEQLPSVGDGGGHAGHLERRGEDVTLPNAHEACVGVVPQAVLWIVVGVDTGFPFGTGHHARGIPAYIDAGGFPKAELAGVISEDRA